ncbi:MAG: hypothetical protein OXC59_09210, partial [Acidimicrobiaceae bacterium]|nr:hypothetical protein [Acidimicrobiaceae bacterium]
MVRLRITGASDPPAIAEFEVWNNERGVLTGFAESSYTVAEGGAAATVTIELSDTPGRSVTIPISAVYRGGASAADYSGIPASVTFAADESSKTFTVSAVDDSVDDDGESVVISLGSFPHAVSAWSVRTRSVTIPITDNDDDVVVSAGVTVSESALTVAEDTGTVTYTVVLDSDPTHDVTVTVASDDGTVAVVDGTDSNTDFTASETLVFNPTGGTKPWNVAQTVTVTGVDDAIDNPNNRRRSVISHTTASTDAKYNEISGIDSVTVTVTDDDVPAVQFASASYAGGEASGDRSVTVTVNASPVPAVNTVVSYTVTGTAASGSDFTELSGTATIAAGDSSVPIPVAVLDDNIDEPSETIILTLGAGSGHTLGARAATTVTVTDDDAPPSAITLSVDADTGKDNVQLSVAEDGGARTVRVTATITSATRFAASQDVTVSVGAATDTATEGTDYESVAAQMITIPAGAASASTTFVLTPTNDTLSEPTQSLSITGTLGSVVFKNTKIDITDDETVPSIALSVVPSSVAEGGGTTNVAVTATVGGTVRFDAARTVGVSVTGSGGSGVVGFTAVPNFTFTIAAGAGSGSGTFVLTPAVDGTDETDETVTVSGSVSGTPTPTVTSATLALTDDDPTTVTLSRVDSGAIVEDASASAADRAAELTVTLDRALVVGEQVDVPLEFSGAGITIGDFGLALKTGDGVNTGVTLTGAASLTPTVRLAGAAAQTATLVLTVVDDSTDEGDSETLTVALGDLADTDLATNTGGGAAPSDDGVENTDDNTFGVVITDDDDPPAPDDVAVTL